MEIITENDAEKLLGECKFERCRLTIPFSAITYYGDYRILEWSAITIQEYLSTMVECNHFVCYSQKEVFFDKRCSNMKTKFTVEIPYGNRSNYYGFIDEVNKLVDDDGLVSLLVNNNPYGLESYLVIETDEGVEQIKSLIKQSKLQLDTSKGLTEFFDEMALRKWNVAAFNKKDTKEKIIEMLSSLYLFAEEAVIEESGFTKSNFIRKKVFISYCHSNKDLVTGVVDKLEEIGTHVWIDKEDIMVGEHILGAVLSGISQSNLAIFFLSKETLNSHFAKYEIKNVMQKLIYNKKAWYLIKMDDVDLDEIFDGLGQFLYYDFAQNNNIDELIADIAKKIKACAKDI